MQEIKMNITNAINLIHNFNMKCVCRIYTHTFNQYVSATYKCIIFTKRLISSV